MSDLRLLVHPDKKHSYYQIKSSDTIGRFVLCQVGGSLSSLKSYNSEEEAFADGWKDKTEFKAWVVLDHNNKAICYLDESLGENLEMGKKYHERRNYKIIELTGVIK